MINIALPFPSADYTIKNRLTPEEINAPFSEDPVKYNLARLEANEEKRRQEHNANPPGPHTLKTLKNVQFVPAAHEAGFLTTLPFIAAGLNLALHGRNSRALTVPATALATAGQIGMNRAQQLMIKPIATYAANLANRLGIRALPALLSAAADNPQTEESQYLPYFNDADKTIGQKVKTFSNALVKNYGKAGKNLFVENATREAMKPIDTTLRGVYPVGREAATNIDNYLGTDPASYNSLTQRWFRSAIKLRQMLSGLSPLTYNDLWRQEGAVVIGDQPRLLQTSNMPDYPQLIKKSYNKYGSLSVPDLLHDDVLRAAYGFDGVKTLFDSFKDNTILGDAYVDDSGNGKIRFNQDVYVDGPNKSVIQDQLPDLIDTTFHEINHGISAKTRGYQGGSPDNAETYLSKYRDSIAQALAEVGYFGNIDEKTIKKYMRAVKNSAEAENERYQYMFDLTTNKFKNARARELRNKKTMDVIYKSLDPYYAKQLRRVGIHDKNARGFETFLKEAKAQGDKDAINGVLSSIYSSLVDENTSRRFGEMSSDLLLNKDISKYGPNVDLRKIYDKSPMFDHKYMMWANHAIPLDRSGTVSVNDILNTDLGPEFNPHLWDFSK